MHGPSLPHFFMTHHMQGNPAIPDYILRDQIPLRNEGNNRPTIVENSMSLCADSSEPGAAWDSVSPSLSALPLLALCVCLSLSQK